MGRLWRLVALLALASGCAGILDIGDPVVGGAPDGGVSDASGGGNDAVGRSDGSDASFCARLSPAPAFCFDFDGPPMSTAFDDFTKTTLPTLDTSDPKSPPAAWKLETASGGDTTSYYAKTLPVDAPTTFDVSMDVAMDVDQLFAFEVVFVTKGGLKYRFELSPGNTSFYFAEKDDDRTIGEATNPALLMKGWQRFRFLVDFAGRSYSLWIGSAKVLERPMATEGHTGTPTFKFGSLFHTGAFSLRVDNLVLDTK